MCHRALLRLECLQRQSMSEVRRAKPGLDRRTTADRYPPPPRDAFAAFGKRSAILPPATVRSPQCIEIGEQVLVMQGAWLSVIERRGGERYEPRLRIGD